MLLVGDIGGTNTRLALFSKDATRVEHQDVLPSAEHPSLSSAIDAFLGPKKKRPHLSGATFGIAGPVIRGRVRATNLPWVVDERVLARQLGLKHVTLINDLVALALGAVAAKRKDLHVLLGTKPPRGSGGNIVVIAAGTGLGEAALVWDGKRLVPCGGEGGHSEFAPRSDLEWELRAFIAERIGGRVSCERVLSGPGIGTIYDFFRQKRGVKEAAAIAHQIEDAKDRNAMIGELGTAKKSDACVQTLALFAGIYGAEAGNLALKFLATGGVFLAGKIASAMVPILGHRFAPAFVDKGRMSTLLQQIPVAIVKSSSIGLHGSARHAAGLT
jgi:glucokinase